jgi:predicted CXXCH cytochrome family protein
MKIKNGPVLCPRCGCISAYYEVDRLSAKRDHPLTDEHSTAWNELLKNHKKKAFCLMCHKTLNLPGED